MEDAETAHLGGQFWDGRAATLADQARGPFPNPVALGLGRVLNNPAQKGKFKVPTLRNVAKTASSGHNGHFGTLYEIVDLYNTGDATACFPAEVPDTVNSHEPGDWGLTPEEVDATVSLLLTLSDGLVVHAP